MKKFLMAAVATIATVAISLPVTAKAQTPNVFDAHNKLVGPLVGENTTVVTLNGFKQYLSVGQQDLATNAILYFGGPNCQGQAMGAFDRYSELFPHALYDGHTLYYLHPGEWGNYAVGSKLDSAGCSNLPEGQTLVSTGAYATTSPFTPPFSVK